MTGSSESEVRKAEQAQLDAARRGDPDAFGSHFHHDMDVFWFDGRPLLQAPGSQEALSRPLHNGGKFDFEYRDLNVHVYHDKTAVSTCTMIGDIVAPDGKLHHMTFRLTSIRVQEGDKWKIVHWHESPVQSES